MRIRKLEQQKRRKRRKFRRRKETIGENRDVRERDGSMKKNEMRGQFNDFKISKIPTKMEIQKTRNNF